MKKSKKIGMTAMVVALMLLLPNLVSAQGILDGVWFEVTVKTKTLWWQSATDPIQSRADSFTAYMQFDWQSGGSGFQDYNCDLWTQNVAGTWENLSTESWRLYNEDNKSSLVSNTAGVWYVGDNRYTTDANLRMKINADSSGAFKKATFDALGCNVGIALPGGSDAYGGCTMKGKSLKVAPF